MRLQKVSGSVGLQSSLLKWSSVDEQYGEYAIGKMLKSRNFFEKALDLGAGTGRDLEIIRQHSPNSELYGIEFNAKQCALLESKGVKTFQVD
jgi:ubiquinone/menaquinone biosynthesis C-methylase UbiE